MSLGCADKQALQQYYTLEEKRTNAIIQSISQQSLQRSADRTNQMQAFSSAATVAATTEEASDDIAIAMAWGFMLGQPSEVHPPQIQPVKAPDQNSDLLRAWTPIIGMAMPFLYPLMYGLGGAGSGNTYTARENAKISFNSENSGSMNTAGGNMELANTDNRIQLEDDCLNCQDGEQGYRIQGEAETQPVDPEEGTCSGWTGSTTMVGDTLFLGSPSSGCSCNSWQAGRCSP